MAEKTPLSKKGFSADWLMRGALTKIGDSFDRLTGRRWVPSSSLAASELIERLKKLLDSEAREIPGKGTVVPHNIKLKMQWDKFSDDAEDAMRSLRTELLAAVVDHINNSLYYTYAPVSLEVRPDYFIEGVKLYVSFDKFDDEEGDVEVNVTVPAVDVSEVIPPVGSPSPSPGVSYIARFEIKGVKKERRLEFPAGSQRSVGRTGANDLMLADDSISKIHASLAASKDGELSVADTGSTNGTFINGERIAYGKAIRLGDRDRITFGVIDVAFERVATPALETEDEGGAVADAETTEIDGLEFMGRTTPVPGTISAEGSADTSPAIPMPLETMQTDRTSASDSQSENDGDGSKRDELGDDGAKLKA